VAGFGTEVLFFCGLGYIVLGPKRMQEVLQHIARAKAQFDKMRSEIKSQLTSELEGRANDAESARPEQPAP
jgi:Sec-independent protein translocase protein TatA